MTINLSRDLAIEYAHDLLDYYEQQLVLAMAQNNRNALIHWRVKYMFLERDIIELENS